MCHCRLRDLTRMLVEPSCAVIVGCRAYIRSTTANNKERRGGRDAIGRVFHLAAHKFIERDSSFATLRFPRTMTPRFGRTNPACCALMRSRILRGRARECVRHSTYIANRHTCMAHESGVSGARGACSSEWKEQRLHACSESIIF
jgi:hypothetical protein